MRIGEIAKLTGLNISNIRFYERKGLLCPEREEDSKYRDYTEADVLRVKENQIDQYLDYVHQEEEKGVGFAKVEELLEDITEYTREGILSWNPIRVWLYKQSWTSVVFTLFFWGLIIMVPMSHLIDVYLKRTTLNIPFLFMYGSIVVIYYLGFRKFRKAKRR